MANCSKTCSSSDLKFIYIFVSQNRTFAEANTICQKSNGTLAKELNRIDYVGINSCCSSTQRFRIGLVSNSTCNDTHPYFWVGNPTNCVDKGDLKILSNFSNSTCQTASININRFRSASNGLNAKLNDCNRNMPFICQRPNALRSLVTKNGSITASTTGSTPAAAAALSLPAIIGVAVGLLILLLLVFSLLFWRCKKRNKINHQVSGRSSNFSNLQKNIVSNPENQNQQIVLRLVSMF